MCQSQTPHGWSSHWRPALSVKRKPHTSTHTHTDILVWSRYLVCQPAAMCLSTCGFAVHNLATRRVEDTCQEERAINKSQGTKIVLLRDLRAWGQDITVFSTVSAVLWPAGLFCTIPSQVKGQSTSRAITHQTSLYRLHCLHKVLLCSRGATGRRFCKESVRGVFSQLHRL